MRPHLIVDLQPWASLALDKSDASTFNITIEATNVFTVGDLNKDEVHI
jgi:hypothetical protein